MASIDPQPSADDPVGCIEDGAPRNLPRRLGPNWQKGLVGSGKHGDVYELADSCFTTPYPFPVVIKILKVERAPSRLELYLQAEQRSQHIVPILDVVQVPHDGTLKVGLVMPRGVPLVNVLSAGRPSDITFGIILDVLRALEYLHAVGVVYNDLHIGQVLLHEGTAKITDFGYARQDASSFANDVHAFGRFVARLMFNNRTEVEHICTMLESHVPVEDLHDELESVYGWILSSCLHPDPSARPSLKKVLGFIQDKLPRDAVVPTRLVLKQYPAPGRLSACGCGKRSSLAVIKASTSGTHTSGSSDQIFNQGEYRT
jgi:hypothetical protein